jgi:hypothetical protein
LGIRKVSSKRALSDHHRFFCHNENVFINLFIGGHIADFEVTSALKTRAKTFLSHLVLT